MLLLCLFFFIIYFDSTVEMKCNRFRWRIKTKYFLNVESNHLIISIWFEYFSCIHRTMICIFWWIYQFDQRMLSTPIYSEIEQFTFLFLQMHQSHKMHYWAITSILSQKYIHWKKISFFFSCHSNSSEIAFDILRNQKIERLFWRCDETLNVDMDHCDLRFLTRLFLFRCTLA